jgi:RNA polymerase sigma-70 factor (ECF subfamily)
MYRIALNTAISWVRKAEVRSRTLPPSAVEAAPDDDKTRVLHQLIAELDQMNRALLLLYLDDLSYAEIGEVLGITESNVGVRINRLKQQLRDQIEREEGN